MLIKRIFFFTILFTFNTVFAQQKQVIDQVAAVVGGYILLQSDIEKQYNQTLAQGVDATSVSKCDLFDQLVIQKLLLNQASIDSITVTETQVEGELDKRMRYFVSQIGSEEKLEDYFHTTIPQLKSELRGVIKDQLTVQNMQQHITKDITITPQEVRKYFNSIPADSLPYIDTEIEIAQIVKKPAVSNEAIKAVRDRLNEFRDKIKAGDDFAVFATLYSEDQGSAKSGGELGFFGKGQMVPEFEAAAYNLKPGEISPIIQTKFGYHIMQLIERRGEQLNARHILLSPKINEADLLKASNQLDSIHKAIQSGSITFEEAAATLSDDEETKNNGGLIINAETGNNRLAPDKIDRLLFFTVDTMTVGNISAPIIFQTEENKTAFRIVKLKSRTTPHRANLKDDYQKIQDAAKIDKENKTVNDWVERKAKSTFIQINKTVYDCPEMAHWNLQN